MRFNFAMRSRGVGSDVGNKFVPACHFREVLANGWSGQAFSRSRRGSGAIVRAAESSKYVDGIYAPVKRRYRAMTMTRNVGRPYE